MKGDFIKLTATLSALVFGATWLALSQDSDGFGGEPFYRNCSAARAAGVTPLDRGEPGYRSKLDADNDGIACEYYPRR